MSRRRGPWRKGSRPGSTWVGGRQFAKKLNACDVDPVDRSLFRRIACHQNFPDFHKAKERPSFLFEKLYGNPSENIVNLSIQSQIGQQWVQRPFRCAADAPVKYM